MLAPPAKPSRRDALAFALVVAIIVVTGVASIVLIALVASSGSLSEINARSTALASVAGAYGIVLLALFIWFLVEVFLRDVDTDKIEEHGGPVFAFWEDWGSCLFGCCCPRCQIAESVSSATGESCCGIWLALTCFPICGHCCVASCMGKANEMWGGTNDCIYRYLCILFCPHLAGCQMARAVKGRRAYEARGGNVQVSIFTSNPNGVATL